MNTQIKCNKKKTILSTLVFQENLRKSLYIKSEKDTAIPFVCDSSLPFGCETPGSTHHIYMASHLGHVVLFHLCCACACGAGGWPFVRKLYHIPLTYRHRVSLLKLSNIQSKTCYKVALSYFNSLNDTLSKLCMSNEHASTEVSWPLSVQLEGTSVCNLYGLR